MKEKENQKQYGKYFDYIIRDLVMFTNPFIKINLSVGIYFKFYFSELYEWCLRENWADANLIAKWKK